MCFRNMLASIFRYFAVESFASVILNAWCAEREKKKKMGVAIDLLARAWLWYATIVGKSIGNNNKKHQQNQLTNICRKPFCTFIDDRLDVRLLSVSMNSACTNIENWRSHTHSTVPKSTMQTGEKVHKPVRNATHFVWFIYVYIVYINETRNEK